MTKIQFVKLLTIALVGFIIGFMLADCNLYDYTTGFLAGAGCVATFAWWLEDFTCEEDESDDEIFQGKSRRR